MAARADEVEEGDAPRQCWCCLESTTTKAQPLLHCGCACRGSAGWAHVDCLAQAAGAHSFAEKGAEMWTTCPTCTHEWTGRVQLDLARAYSRRCARRPREDAERQFTDCVLGVALRAQGMFVEALAIEERALATCRELYGSEDERTITAMEALARVHYRMGEYEDAVLLEQQVLAFFRRTDGDAHQSTLFAMESLAHTYADMDQISPALALLEECLETQRSAQPGDDECLAAAMQSLACVYCDSGEMEKAVPLFKESLEISRRMFGSAHPNTATTVGNLGECYCKLGKHSAAAPLLEEAVARLRAVYGDEHTHVGYVRRWSQANGRQDTHGPRYKDYAAEQETPYERRAKRRRRRD